MHSYPTNPQLAAPSATVSYGPGVRTRPPICYSRRRGWLVVPCSAASDRGLTCRLASLWTLPGSAATAIGVSRLAQSPHRRGSSPAVPCNKIFKTPFTAWQLKSSLLLRSSQKSH